MSMRRLRKVQFAIICLYPLSVFPKWGPKKCPLTFNMFTILCRMCAKTIRTSQDTVEGEGI
jgi:hypothetical protein